MFLAKTLFRTVQDRPSVQTCNGLEGGGGMKWGGMGLKVNTRDAPFNEIFASSEGQTAIVIVFQPRHRTLLGHSSVHT